MCFWLLLFLEKVKSKHLAQMCDHKDAGEAVSVCGNVLFSILTSKFLGLG